MDFSGIELEEAAPFMRSLEQALDDKRVEVISLSDPDNTVFATLSRDKAIFILRELEQAFFAKAD